MSAPLIGAIIGFVLGVAASISVGMTDLRKREAGIRVRAHYRGSLFLTPILLAILGGLVGGAISAIF